MVIVALLSTNLGTVEPIRAPSTGDIEDGGRSANFLAVAAKKDWVLTLIFIGVFRAKPPAHSFFHVEGVVCKQLSWGGMDRFVFGKVFGHGQKRGYGVYLKLPIRLVIHKSENGFYDYYSARMVMQLTHLN